VTTLDPNFSNSGKPADVQLIAKALEKAKPWGLEAEFVWSLSTHLKTYPNDKIENAVEIALDDWDI